MYGCTYSNVKEGEIIGSEKMYCMSDNYKTLLMFSTLCPHKMSLLGALSNSFPFFCVTFLHELYKINKYIKMCQDPYKNVGFCADEI